MGRGVLSAFGMAASAVAVLLLGSCGAMKGYVGPDRLPEETAVIIAVGGTRISKVDDLKVSSANRITVLPGTHSVQAGFVDQAGMWTVWSRWDYLITFAAEAGHTYEVFRGSESGLTMTAYVLDKKTGNRVDIDWTFPEEALQVIEADIRAKPDKEWSWYAKGVALQGLKRYQEAIETFDKALELKPTLIDALNQKGQILLALKKYQEALDAFERVTKFYPHYQQTWHDKGLALHNLQRYEEALGAYDKAIELKPADAKAWSGKGQTFLAMTRYEQALGAFDKAIGLKPSLMDAWNGKGSALQSMDRQEEAARYFDKAKELKSR